jgi:hypothetical protein
MTTFSIEQVATICFAGAVVHTFLTKVFARLADRFPEGSLAENLLHYLAEVEVVFGLWAAAFLGYLSYVKDISAAVRYLESVNFTEPAFVFVIMAMASTKPVMAACEGLVSGFSSLMPRAAQSAVYFLTAMIVTPLLGSFVTEPAAMVVAALLLQPLVFERNRSATLRYSVLAVLLVNISIGGTLTHFAAPPVIMVSKAWGWDLEFMLMNFGWKCAIVVAINAVLVYLLNFKEIRQCSLPKFSGKAKMPLWMTASHVLFMAAVVSYHGSMAFFVPLFLLFLGWTDVTREHQSPLKLRESLLVAFFLGGLVTLGQLQRWWIEPIVSSLAPLQLFIGATALTAVTDNAALTYLGTLVPGLSDVSKYVLVAGAVAGGGLTVIANAPNPIAIGLLKSGFSGHSVSPLSLLLAAIIPTILACLGLWYL